MRREQIADDHRATHTTPNDNTCCSRLKECVNRAQKFCGGFHHNVVCRREPDVLLVRGG